MSGNRIQGIVLAIAGLLGTLALAMMAVSMKSVGRSDLVMMGLYALPAVAFMGIVQLALNMSVRTLNELPNWKKLCIALIFLPFFLAVFYAITLLERSVQP